MADVKPFAPASAHGALAPIASAVLGIGLLSVMDAAVKYLAPDFATSQLVVLRYFFGVLSAAIVFFANGTRWPDLATMRPHAWRSVVVVITAGSFYYALSTLPLAVTLALSFTSPILIALFARLTLGERPGGHVALALALGFFGVLVVLWDQLAQASGGTVFGAVAALVSSVCYAIAMVSLKWRAARDPIPTIVLLQNLFACLLSAPVAALQWSLPNGGQWILFAVIGTLGTVGHLCLTWAYGRADASRLGVLEYTAFIWAVIIGFLVFAEWPTLGTLAGAALIVAGAILANRTPRIPASRAPDAEIGP
ncbi:DMT family transporter [Ancylobacter sp. 6x-1]|uniref:DMT family transporter n=1 Tax=Ancylobacter crimeensis TaxID=2579147 RepID=A0ABT0DAV1_9HYPH|nr:DMT family transporter [Ancylobacter crimeensis]MCK0197086.1 DMT family transporter [Ancylobacter crimeensis]